MTLTLRFYELSILFDDDMRLISYAIAEHTGHDTEYIYKRLLKGKFDKYVTILEEITDRITMRELIEWKLDTLLSLDLSRKEIFIKTDYQNIEG